MEFRPTVRARKRHRFCRSGPRTRLPERGPARTDCRLSTFDVAGDAQPEDDDGVGGRPKLSADSPARLGLSRRYFAVDFAGLIGRLAVFVTGSMKRTPRMNSSSALPKASARLVS